MAAERSSSGERNQNRRCFMLTGFDEEERQRLISIINSLRASYVFDSSNSQTFRPICTHVIAKKPCRSEKFLCACASGKWVLKSRYLYDCQQEKKWLNEEKYEWGKKLSTKFPKELQEAPRRWRSKLSKEDVKFPFENWIVGIYVSKSVTVYRRLVEVGGGTAVNLRTTKKESFSHILVEPGLKQFVEHYHKRGVPCTRPEYLAQYLVQSPPPNPSHYSVFGDPATPKRKPSNPQARIVECTVRLNRNEVTSSQESMLSSIASKSDFADKTAATDDKDRADAIRKSKASNRSSKINGPDADHQGSRDHITCETAPSADHQQTTQKTEERDATIIAGTELVGGHQPVGRDDNMEIDVNCVVDNVQPKKPAIREFPTTSISHAHRYDSDVEVTSQTRVENGTRNRPNSFQAKIVSNNDSECSMKANQTHKGQNPSKKRVIQSSDGKELSRKSASFDKQSVKATGGPDGVTSKPASVLSADKECRSQSPTALDVRHNLTVTSQASTPSSRFAKPCSVLTSAGFRSPDWLKEKRPLLRKVLQKAKQSDNYRDVSPPSKSGNYVTSNEAPRRFNSKEMTMLESFVGHTRSILMTCGMLLSRSSYPPPDLLYLLMKKYLLEADSPSASFKTTFLLNSLLLMHPPSTSHIRHDDIYLQAMSVSRTTESSLLAAADIELFREVNLWNNPSPHSNAWKFYSTIAKQAMHSSDHQRCSNGIALLVFVTSLIADDPDLLVEMFWPGTKRRDLSTSLGSFLDYFCIALRAYVDAGMKMMTSTEDEEVQEDEEDKMDCDDQEDSSDEESLDEELDESDHDPYTKAADVLDCFKKTLRTVLSHLKSKHPGDSTMAYDVICRGLVESLRDPEPKILDKLFLILDEDLGSCLACHLLEKCFRDDLARLKPNAVISLQTIVERHLRMLPMPPNLAAKDLESKPARENSEHVIGAGHVSYEANESNEHSDKENVTAVKKSPSAGSGSKTSVAAVNRRNAKGETVLHRACMQNRPEKVAELLSVPGIDPNARDNAGWTPLGEACNHGHLDCVAELLKLPVANSHAAATSNEAWNPPLVLDLLACPEEGTTPLHDALDNGHVEVAKVLIDKGGVELLYIIDKQGKTPLDSCASEDLASQVLEAACEIASCKLNEKKIEEEKGEEREIDAPSDEDYAKVLPPPSLVSSSGWKKSCQVYLILVRHLLSSYILSSNINDIIHLFSEEIKQTAVIPYSTVFDKEPASEVTVENKEYCDELHEQLLRCENDLAYVLKWQKVEAAFNNHLRKITGNTNGAFELGVLFYEGSVLSDLQKGL
ncbi:uncharacterized protein LOC143461533 isoform X2 [Clavelina lepadiformis]|uniref:uncharacterized protein LOC143461533 isoform X2 n=1 Tax=Clavelina lepadiformis TaxID=159417 RepID=UPI004041BCB3